MSSASNLGDVVRSDGTLKDASEIIWSYDADESIPFPSGDNAHSSPPSSGHAPATPVTAHAVCQTSHVSRPCQCYLEEDEVESASSTITLKTSSVKCKATSDPPSATHKIVINMVSDDGSSNSRAPSPSLPPTEPASDNYEVLQAMADTDNQVHSPKLLILLAFSFQLQVLSVRTREQRTADIRTIFRCDRVYIHPDTMSDILSHALDKYGLHGKV